MKDSLRLGTICICSMLVQSFTSLRRRDHRIQRASQLRAGDVQEGMMAFSKA